MLRRGLAGCGVLVGVVAFAEIVSIGVRNVVEWSFFCDALLVLFLVLVGWEAAWWLVKRRLLRERERFVLDSRRLWQWTTSVLAVAAVVAGGAPWISAMGDEQRVAVGAVWARERDRLLQDRGCVRQSKRLKELLAVGERLHESGGGAEELGEVHLGIVEEATDALDVRLGLGLAAKFGRPVPFGRVRDALARDAVCAVERIRTAVQGGQDDWVTRDDLWVTRELPYMRAVGVALARAVEGSEGRGELTAAVKAVPVPPSLLARSVVRDVEWTTDTVLKWYSLQARRPFAE